MRFIRISDPLYGSFDLPGYLDPFLRSPEFSRLGGVRLLNHESLALAALSEVRRRSHTLGVLHLGTRLGLLDFNEQEIKALLFAIVLHDIGTPPFGHTLEYEFISRLGRDHENAASQMLDGRHHMLNLDHQIYAGRTVELYRLVSETGCEETIRSILDKRHPLSVLIFGDLDLDNIDNVYRMAWYLGHHIERRDALELAGSIDVDREGRKYLSQAKRSLIERWLSVRRMAYSSLLNSTHHRQAQNIFAAIIHAAMEWEDGQPPLIDEGDWYKTDEELMTCLRKEPRLRTMFGDLANAGKLEFVELGFELGTRLTHREAIAHREALSGDLHAAVGGPLYVSILPLGETLERKVQFLDRCNGQAWSVGNPRLTYRLRVDIGSRTVKRTAVRATKLAVWEKTSEYAERAEWRNEVEGAASPP